MSPPSRRALLIDDEPLARLELRRLLAAHPEVTVVGEAGSLADARALTAAGGYDLVFLDVQLRGGSGFDLLDSLAPEAQVVFVTAYDRYAVRAFEVNALDYLLKPVRPARLAACLARDSATDAAPPASAPPLATGDRVFIKSGQSRRFVPVADIAAIRSCENYTEVFLADGERLLVLRSLKAWESLLPAEAFVRIHRQTLVNLAHVRRIARVGDDEVRFELGPALPSFAASRRQIADLRQRFTAAGLADLLP